MTDNKPLVTAMLLAAFALLLPAVAWSVGTALFTCSVTGLAGFPEYPQQMCPDSGVPGSVGYTAKPVTSQVWPPEITLNATATGGNGSLFSSPKAVIDASATSSISGTARASFYYEVAAQATLLKYVGISIPVIMFAGGSASASAVGPEESIAQGLARATIAAGAPGDSVSAVANDCVNTDPSFCAGEPIVGSFSLQHIFWVQDGDIIFVSAEARGSVIGSSTVDAPATATSNAKVDPYVWIDPLYSFELDGEMIRAADAFELIWSENVEYSGPPAPVPVPAAAWLLASALSSLGWLRRSLR